MDWMAQILDFFIHLDHHLRDIVTQYGAWTYVLLFLIIFCETGLVVTPFLPGDSLLFVVGALAAIQALNIAGVLVLLSAAAVLGDTVNYWIGHRLAPRIFRRENIHFIKREYLERTERFYQKYGGKTIVIARFVPIIRTFAPFLAGVGSMRYGRFLLYNITGGIAWILLFTLAGYFFGNMPMVKKNFTLVIFVIIFLSILPGVIEFLRHRAEEKASQAKGPLKPSGVL